MSALLTSTRDRTTKAKELIASKLLNWETLMAAIGAAAGQGFEKVVISPDSPVNIKGTEMASKTLSKLSRAGFRCDWSTRRLRPEGPEFIVLEIDWSPREILHRGE